MIKQLHIDNYKSLVNFELPLQALTLRLGPNGVGKTAVLDVVFALRRLLSGEAKVTDVDIRASRVSVVECMICEKAYHTR